MAVTLLTISDYARHRGCDEKAVRKALAEGRITRLGTERRCIDPEVADIQWAKNTRARADSKAPSADRPAPGPEGATAKPDTPAGPAAGAQAALPLDDYTASRARRERADAERAEIEVAKMAGRLIDREQVTAAVFDAFRSLRDRLMVVPRRCAPGLVGMVEVREIELLIADELRRALGPDEQAAVDALQAKVLPR